MAVEFARFEMSSPDDTRGLTVALQTLGSGSITGLALLVKVEGTATINDFSRTLALRSINTAIAKHFTAGLPDLQIIISTGCEGLITPGGMIFAKRQQDTRFPGLAMGMSASAPIASDQMVTTKHALIAAQTTYDAMMNAGLSRKDVGLVLVKSPVLTHALSSGLPNDKRSRINSTSLSRGVAALGVGIALGEIAEADLSDDAIAGRDDLYSRRGMVFSGTETQRCEVIVLGNLPGFEPTLRIGLMRDLLDIEGCASVLAPGAPTALAQVHAMARDGKIISAFLKAGLAPDGHIRGHRTTVYSSEMDSDKHLRAAASGVLGVVLGDTRNFVSGGAEHQAPAGGCVFAALVLP